MRRAGVRGCVSQKRDSGVERPDDALHAAEVFAADAVDAICAEGFELLEDGFCTSVPPTRPLRDGAPHPIGWLVAACLLPLEHPTGDM